MHRATTRFWSCFDELPASTQKTARKNYKIIKNNPKYPSLHFKKVGRFWSVRISIHCRALALQDGKNFIWLWIGRHEEYERLIK